jgi:uncharacterized protein with GYD domain
MSNFDIAIQKFQQIISIPLGIIFALFVLFKVTEDVEKTIKPKTKREQFEKAIINITGFFIKCIFLTLMIYILLILIFAYVDIATEVFKSMGVV